MLTLKEANAVLTQAATECAIPFVPLEHRDMTAMGCTVVGDVPVSGVKVRGRWAVPQEDVRRAAGTLRRAAAVAGPPVLLAPLGEVEERSRDGWADDARWYLRYVLDNIAYSPDYQPFRNGAAEPHHLGLLAYTSADYATATVPRGIADLLTRGDAVQAGQETEAARCTGCGAVGHWRAGEGNVWSWRRETDTGHITRCHECEKAAASDLLAYSGEYRGIPYGATRNGKGTRASLYACTVCGNSARHWDHCHEHGYVRGPLCVSCNQRAKLAAREPGEWAGHISECPDCPRSALTSG